MAYPEEIIKAKRKRAENFVGAKHALEDLLDEVAMTADQRERASQFIYEMTIEFDKANRN